MGCFWDTAQETWVARSARSAALPTLPPIARARARRRDRRFSAPAHRPPRGSLFGAARSCRSQPLPDKVFGIISGTFRAVFWAIRGVSGCSNRLSRRAAPGRPPPRARGRHLRRRSFSSTLRRRDSVRRRRGNGESIRSALPPVLRNSESCRSTSAASATKQIGISIIPKTTRTRPSVAFVADTVADRRGAGRRSTCAVIFTSAGKIGDVGVITTQIVPLQNWFVPGCGSITCPTAPYVLWIPPPHCDSTSRPHASTAPVAVSKRLWYRPRATCRFPSPTDVISTGWQ
jgi:hypothetical protein